MLEEDVTVAAAAPAVVAEPTVGRVVTDDRVAGPTIVRARVVAVAVAVATKPVVVVPVAGAPTVGGADPVGAAAVAAVHVGTSSRRSGARTPSR